MQLSKLVKQVALAAAGATLAVGGSMSAAHAFTFIETSANEPNNSIGTATNVGSAVYGGFGNVIVGELSAGGDSQDFFRFSLPAPGATDGVLSSIRLSGDSGIVPRFNLYKALNVYLGTSSINPAPTPSTTALLVGALDPGDYLIEVFRGSGDQTGFVGYRINADFTPVPEPFTILGSAAAIGVGSAIQRKRRKQLATQKSS